MLFRLYAHCPLCLYAAQPLCPMSQSPSAFLSDTLCPLAFLSIYLNGSLIFLAPQPVSNSSASMPTGFFVSVSLSLYAHWPLCPSTSMVLTLLGPLAPLYLYSLASMPLAPLCPFVVMPLSLSHFKSVGALGLSVPLSLWP